jgi:hypothetical protein
MMLYDGPTVQVSDSQDPAKVLTVALESDMDGDLFIQFSIDGRTIIKEGRFVTEQQARFGHKSTPDKRSFLYLSKAHALMMANVIIDAYGTTAVADVEPLPAWLADPDVNRDPYLSTWVTEQAPWEDTQCQDSTDATQTESPNNS